jgi:SHS2 domain-containing protein
MGRSSYREIDHTGDIGIDAEAGDEASLYACCAGALFDILVGEAPVETREARKVHVEAPDSELLMVRWLRELLYLHTVERWLFRGFEVVLEGPEGGRRRLEATARGEKFDPDRHSIRTELKAVTYHQISIRRAPDGVWRARVIFDV